MLIVLLSSVIIVAALKMMQLRTPLAQVQTALLGIDTEY